MTVYASNQCLSNNNHSSSDPFCSFGTIKGMLLCLHLFQQTFHKQLGLLILSILFIWMIKGMSQCHNLFSTNVSATTITINLINYVIFNIKGILQYHHLFLHEKNDYSINLYNKRFYLDDWLPFILNYHRLEFYSFNKIWFLIFRFTYFINIFIP